MSEAADIHSSTAAFLNAQGQLSPSVAVLLKHSTRKSVDKFVGDNERRTAAGLQRFENAGVPSGSRAEPLLLDFLKTRGDFNDVVSRSLPPADRS